MNITQEELNKKIEEINKPFKEHNRIVKLSDTELLSELIGVKNGTKWNKHYKENRKRVY